MPFSNMQFKLYTLHALSWQRMLAAKQDFNKEIVTEFDLKLVMI